jgi:Protein of unknown function (DUF1622)
MVFNDVIEKIGMTIDAAGVVVIVIGAAIAFVVSAVRLSRHESDVYRCFRQQLGQTILLGLELLVADGPINMKGGGHLDTCRGDQAANKRQPLRRARIQGERQNAITGARLAEGDPGRGLSLRGRAG